MVYSVVYSYTTSVYTVEGCIVQSMVTPLVCIQQKGVQYSLWLQPQCAYSRRVYSIVYGYTPQCVYSRTVYSIVYGYTTSVYTVVGCIVQSMVIPLVCIQQRGKNLQIYRIDFSKLWRFILNFKFFFQGKIFKFDYV